MIHPYNHDTSIPLSVSLLHPLRNSTLVNFILEEANFCNIVADVVIFNSDVDKFTIFHNLGSDAMSLHLQQTLDILFSLKNNTKQDVSEVFCSARLQCCYTMPQVDQSLDSALFKG